jgi:hypothetical protein
MADPELTVDLMERECIIKKPEVKLCKDCYYFIYYHDYWEESVFGCEREKDGKSKNIDLVTGENEDREPLDCYKERSDPERCGSEGKFWRKRSEIKFTD